MYNEVEVKAILIAVHNIENVGLNSKKVLLNSIEWLRCQYEITQDESFLIKAVWHLCKEMLDVGDGQIAARKQ